MSDKNIPVLRERDYLAVLARPFWASPLRLPEAPPPKKGKGRYKYDTWEEDKSREDSI